MHMFHHLPVLVGRAFVWASRLISFPRGYSLLYLKHHTVLLTLNHHIEQQYGNFVIASFSRRETRIHHVYQTIIPSIRKTSTQFSHKAMHAFQNTLQTKCASQQSTPTKQHNTERP